MVGVWCMMLDVLPTQQNSEDDANIDADADADRHENVYF